MTTKENLSRSLERVHYNLFSNTVAFGGYPHFLRVLPSQNNFRRPLASRLDDVARAPCKYLPSHGVVQEPAIPTRLHFVPGVVLAPAFRRDCTVTGHEDDLAKSHDIQYTRIRVFS
jgi:hypothetical protein